MHRFTLLLAVVWFAATGGVTAVPPAPAGRAAYVMHFDDDWRVARSGNRRRAMSCGRKP